MTALRPYQTDVIAAFDRTREHKNRIILVAPTGSGKTVIAAAIIRAEIAARGSVLVLAHRREIIAQTSQKLSRHRDLARDHPGRVSAAPARARASRIGPDSAPPGDQQ